MRGRTYTIEFGTALLLYTGLLFASAWAVETFSLVGAARIAVIVSPMLGAAAAVRAVIRHTRRMDELERQIAFEAYAFAFAGTAFATFTWGFRESPGRPNLSMFVVGPLMCTLLVAGLLVARRRFR